MISGPVGCIVIKYRNRSYYLFSDKHNSTEGMCTNPESISFIQYVTNKLSDDNPVDFYIESPFVLTDIDSYPTSSTDNFDMIESLQYELWDCMRRDKSTSEFMPNGWIHYCDIRDIYEDTKFANNIRISASANPLSNSMCVKVLNKLLRCNYKLEEENNVISKVNEVIAHTQFILNNSRRILDSFVTEVFDPPYASAEGKLSDDFNNRVERMRWMTSEFDGKRVHRVCKQLLKLNEDERCLITSWIDRRFNEEYHNACVRFNRWKCVVNKLIFGGDMYDNIREEPVLITIAIGSLAMDAYTLARSFYHNESDSVIFFTGLAHTGNYVDFFTNSGGMIVDELSPISGKERCLV